MVEEVFFMPKNSKKVRAIAGILYPESASADWQNKIADLHMMALVSPLHDSDVQADGVLKTTLPCYAYL